MLGRAGRTPAHSSTNRLTVLPAPHTAVMASQAKTRRLLGQFEELSDAMPGAVDIRVAGAEDDPGLWPATRSQNDQALRAALQECDTGAFEHKHTDAGTVRRVPNLATSWVALERALTSVSHVRGTITAAKGD